MNLKPINSRMVNHKVHLSYKDVLLVPYDRHECTVKSRNDPDISTEVCPGKKIQVPLISAPMDSVTGPHMAIAMNNLGCLGINTRYINRPSEIQDQIGAIEKIKLSTKSGYTSCAIGVKKVSNLSVGDLAKRLCDAGLDILCLDIANGNHVLMLDALESTVPLKDKYSLSIIAGNVASGLSAQRLVNCGADAIKVGVGPGAACSTRRVVGFGVPQFTAILDCAEHLHGQKVSIIADGGIRESGDVVKALWAGADAVMSGFVFAGHNECPTIDGQVVYRGMSSRTVSGRTDVAAEGVSMRINPRGPIENTVREYAAAIKSACSMANALNLNQLRNNVEAIRVSTLTTEESDPIKID